MATEVRIIRLCRAVLLMTEVRTQSDYQEAFKWTLMMARQFITKQYNIVGEKDTELIMFCNKVVELDMNHLRVDYIAKEKWVLAFARKKIRDYEKNNIEENGSK